MKLSKKKEKSPQIIQIEEVTRGYCAGNHHLTKRRFLEFDVICGILRQPRSIASIFIGDTANVLFSVLIEQI
ncbi:MAG: hypothetical protein ACK5JD_01285 [Mangrovibacterium sp.]